MAIQKISSTVIGPGAVTSEQIATGAITAADIPDGEITTAKLADDVVTTAKIAANAVTSTEIANGSVTYNQIADGTIITSKLADSQITTSKIADGNITSAKMANDITIGGNMQAADYILEGISTNLADTAVDVFIYDTSKDSDGGAWRKRTQHTSWYNEELNTATRGSRKEFPAVAVIVALPTAGNNVTIYDGDDPDLPMWMKFTLLNQDQVSIAAINGLICLGNKWVANAGYGGNGLVLFDFVADRSRQAMSNETVPAYDPERRGVISGSQATTTIWPKNSANGARFYTLVNYSINDIAMTVLPNAPIDAATGLPVPTIAVATASGTSIIRDDGTVVDVMSGTNAYGVEFTKNNELLHTANDANSTFSIQVRNIPS